jgi:hypothetical protein
MSKKQVPSQEFKVTYEAMSFDIIPLCINMLPRELVISFPMVNDPVPQLLAWLESLVTGSPFADFVYNAEGPDIAFSALKIANSELYRFQIVVHKKYTQRYFKEVSLYSLVNEFYWGLKVFGTTGKYNPEDWEPYTVANRARDKFHWSRDFLVAWLITLDGKNIKKVLHLVYPQFHEEFQVLDTVNLQQKGMIIRKFEDEVMVLRTEDAQFTYHPSYAPCPENWDILQEGERRTWVEQELDVQVFGGLGTPLRRLYSSILEDFLVGQKS